MDFTGRRQSDNVDDRRNNWRLYEAFRRPPPTPLVAQDNQHTRAVDVIAESLLRGEAPPNSSEMSQDEFDFYAETADLSKPVGKTVRYDKSVIDNLLRK